MQNEKGFCLLESLMALTILALVLSSVMLVHSRALAGHVRNNQNIELQENLRISLNRLSRDIRQARAYIYIYNQDGTPAADGRGPRIRYKNAAGEVVEYSYDSKDRELEVKRGSGSPLPLASHIEGVEFQYDAARKVVTIYIKGKKTSGMQPVVQELSTRVQARAL